MPLGRLRPLFRKLATTPTRASMSAISCHVLSANTIRLYLFSRTPVWNCETILRVANRTIDDTRQKPRGGLLRSGYCSRAVMERDMIRFGETVCNNLDATGGREWLETNGIGAFASATITGCHTRRYHGLLIAATT